LKSEPAERKGHSFVIRHSNFVIPLMPPRPAPIKPLLDELREIYAEIERRPLARQCELRTGCCHFRQTGKTPIVTRIEALFAAQGVRASGRKQLTPHPDGTCPMLGKNGKCQMYAHRPFGCRTHFCAAAGGPYPRKHVADLIHRMEALDEKLGWHDGSRPFEDAVEDALQS
jgi:Fe-S-cluster containining protein